MLFNLLVDQLTKSQRIAGRVYHPALCREHRHFFHNTLAPINRPPARKEDNQRADVGLRSISCVGHASPLGINKRVVVNQHHDRVSAFEHASFGLRFHWSGDQQNASIMVNQQLTGEKLMAVQVYSSRQFAEANTIAAGSQIQQTDYRLLSISVY